MNQDKLILRVDLKDKEKDQFQKLKERFNKNKNVDVFREILSYCEQKLNDEEFSFKIQKELISEMNEIIKSPMFIKKYAITSVSQFINASISKFLTEIISTRKSLLHEPFEVFSEISQDARQISKILIDLTSQSSNQNLIEMEEINKKLKGIQISKNQVSEAIEELRLNGYIGILKQNNKSYVWIK